MQTVSKKAFAVLFVMAVFPTLVNADFYVIPTIQKISNVVTVAKSGGQYTDINAAIDSIDDAGAGNRYWIYIGPGKYTVTSPVQLKAYVTVIGSGRDATLIKGAFSTSDASTSAVILGADNATLTNLSVENAGGSGDNSIGIFNDQASPVLEGITVTASGSSDVYGVYNNNTSSPAMTNVTVSVSGSGNVHGILNIFSSSPTMTSVTATASGGNKNSGVYNASSSPTMTGVTAEGIGGAATSNYGVVNNQSSPTMINVTAKASRATTRNYGVYNVESSSPIIRNCTLKGSDGTSYGVHGGTVMVSTVTGGGGGSAVCQSCLDENDNVLDATCNIP